MDGAMKLKQTIAIFGCIAVLGGLVRMLMTPAALIWGFNSPHELVPGFTACILMAIGSIGLYLGQAERVGLLGLLGFLLLAVSNMLTASLVSMVLFLGADLENTYGNVSVLQGVNNFFALLGFVISGIATIRARVLRLWAACLLTAVPFLAFIPFMGDYFPLIWGLSYVGLGLPLWLGGSQPHYSSELPEGRSIN